MSKIDLAITALGNKFVDLRNTLPGDAFNWSWVRPLSQVNYLAIHHSASPDNQTPDVIASYHINHNGWGGIGYHFLIAKDGTVYYVGDISTARANVANLNEKVIGICLIGNFTSGRVPGSEQLDSAHKLCSFFINDYPDLADILSWESVRGHKELPGQSTACPGDNWSSWRQQVVGGIGIIFNPPTSDRSAQISDLYRKILGRDPDIGGLKSYANGSMTIAEITESMINSKEHQDLISVAKEASSMQSQIDSLQTSLASVNQQLIILQEILQQREQEIQRLKDQSASNQPVVSDQRRDSTLTLIGALINLYKFLLPPRKIY